MHSPQSISYSPILLRILASTLVSLIVLIPITQPTLVQSGDFLFTFYLAGRLIIAGRPIDLYAEPTAANMLNSAFNTYAHQVFTGLPASMTAVYMYSPLTALVFVPFGLMSPTMAHLSWEVLSIFALALCSVLLSQSSGGKRFDLFFGALLFLPVLQSLAIGQLGIILGLVPLCLGYWLLLRGRQLSAGFAFSLLFLKPQYLLAALLISLSLCLAGKCRCLAGFASGIALQVGLSLLLFGAPVFWSWLCTLKLASMIYSTANYGTPSHLLSCLTPAVLQLMPVAHRQAAKMMLYLISLPIALHALWTCVNLIRKASGQYWRAIPFVFAISITILPLVLPYLLYYDLSAFVLVAATMYTNQQFATNRFAKRDFLLAWIFINGYLLALLLSGGKQLGQPIFLVAVLALVYLSVLKLSRRFEESLIAAN